MILNGLRVRAFALLPLLAVCSGAFAVAPINAVGPAENKAAAFAEKKAPATLALPPTAPATRIALPAPSDAERGLVKARNAKPPTTLKQMTKGAKSRPLAIGYGRTIATASQRISLAALPWQTLSDGSRAAKVQIVSPDAAALRVALQLAATDPDLSVSFSGNAPNAEVFGPVPANTIADDTARFGVFWSPTLDGDVATIEFHADAGAKIGGVTLIMPRVAHHVVTGAALKSPGKTVADIGTAGPCNIDVACVPPTTAFANARKAVAEFVITWSTGDSILCTGTLLNDSIGSGTPYFLVANHCLDEDVGPRSTNGAASARTINTYWFFDAIACGDHATIPAFVQQASGGALLARSEDWDWGLVRLNAAPPPGTFFSAWNSALVNQNAAVSVIHHPEGDLKKWASGVSPTYQFFDDGSSFIQARYSQGTTEAGSSGAALLTLNTGGGFYEVRGGLFGGRASCQEPSGLDIYSRFDTLLPLVRQYLTPGNNPSGTVVAVEFYNAALQHYFISTDAKEINDLDTGVHVGWERTGFRFLAYATQTAGTNPVCRFYRDPRFGDSHYYSASPQECAETAAKFPDWIHESPNVFYIPLPNTTTGTCPSGTVPVWRFFNQLTTNHRYTTDVATRDTMNSQPSVWTAEGYGPGPYYPIMCTPTGS